MPGPDPPPPPQKLGMVDMAMSPFTAALDLKPNSTEASVIRAAIEKVDDEGEESDML